MTFHSSTEDNDIDFKVKTFLNDAKNWSNFRYKIKLRLNKVNKTKQAVIIEDDGPTMTSVPLQNATVLTVAQLAVNPKKKRSQMRFCNNTSLDNKFPILKLCELPILYLTFWINKNNAFSFYRSQNVLCRSKFFESDQKFIDILCQSQIFCARQKDDLHSVKLVYVPAQKFLKRHKMQ